MRPAQDVHALLAAIWDDAAVGSLMASFAHAGNNRLTVILSCLDLLASSRLDDPDLRAAVDLAQGSGRQFASDLAVLLDGSRRHLGVACSVDLAAALRDAAALQCAARTDAVPVEMGESQGLAVEADPSRLVVALARALEFARRRGARNVQVHVELIEVAAREPGRPGLRKGRYCLVEFVLEGATLPASYSTRAAEAGHLLERLREPDGLELATLEAFAATVRGRCLALDGTDARLHLYLPAAAD